MSAFGVAVFSSWAAVWWPRRSGHVWPNSVQLTHTSEALSKSQSRFACFSFLQFKCAPFQSRAGAHWFIISSFCGRLHRRRHRVSVLEAKVYDMGFENKRLARKAHATHLERPSSVAHVGSSVAIPEQRLAASMQVAELESRLAVSFDVYECDKRELV